MRNQIIVYTKPGCCLCDGLIAKLETVLASAHARTPSTRTSFVWDSLRDFSVTLRDVSVDDTWASLYAGSVPRVFVLDRMSTHATDVASMVNETDHERDESAAREFPRPTPKTSVERIGDDLDVFVRALRGKPSPTMVDRTNSRAWSVSTDAPDTGATTLFYS